MAALLKQLGDHAFGRDASRPEIALALTAGAATVLLAHVALRLAPVELSWWQWGLISLIAFDIGGGVPANATAAAARQYHRPDRPWAPLLFAAGHIHPFVVTLLLPGYSWAAAATLYVGVLVAVSVTLVSPPALRRPVSLVCVALAVPLCDLLAVPAWQWLAPLLLVKLVAAHATLRPEHA